MATEMTIDEAIEILKGPAYGARFEEAKRFVMDNDPTNPILRDVEVKEREYEAENNLSSDDIKVYEENTEALNELADSYTFDDLTQDEDVGNIVDHVVVYETERDKDGQPIQTSEGPAEKMLSKEESRKYTSLIFDAATLKAKMHLTGDETFSTLDAETKAKRYKGLVNRIFFTDLAVTAVAGAVDTKSIPQIGTKEYEDHISQNAEQAMEVFVDAAQDGQNVNILAEHILASVADTAQKVEVYANKLREKAKKLAGNARTKLNEISVGFNTRLNKLEDKADKVSKGLYKKLMKPVLTSMRDNRVQLVGNAVATVALTAALATSAAPVALGAYGAYFAATSWVYPIVERARRNNRIRNEKGEEKLKFKDAWREAKDQLLAKTVKVTDEKTGETKEIENKECKKYIRRAAIKSALGLLAFTGIAVAAQTGSGFVPLSWLTRKLLRKGDVAELGTKAGVIGTKMVVTNTAQATEVGVATGALLKNKSAENKQDLKNAAVGFGVGLASSALTQVLTGNTELFSSKGDELADQIVQNGGAENLGDGTLTATADGTGVETPADTPKESGNWFSRHFGRKRSGVEEAVVAGGTATAAADSTGVETAADSTGVTASADSASVQGSAGGEEVVQQAEFKPFPKKLDPSIAKGIDERHWDIMMSRINNGMIEDIDPNGLDRAWSNLDQIVAETGGDKAETFYNYAELMRNGRRHVDILFSEEKGYYINTPTGSQTIEDEGIIAFAKSKMAANEIPMMPRPHGREFLIKQLNKINIEGMDTEKREAIIKIAMETYDKPQVAGAVEKIHEMFPDMTRAQLTKVRVIVDYNRAFNENGEVMEQLQRAVDCGDMNGFDKDRVTLLLNQRAEILARSNSDAVAYSQEVGDCNGTMLHSRKIQAEEPVQEPVPEPELPPLADPVIEDEPIVVPEAPVLEDTMPKVKLAEYKAPVEEEKIARIFASEHRSDNECDHITGQKEYKDEQLKSMVENSKGR